MQGFLCTTFCTVQGRRGKSAMCQDTPLYKRGGILHSILHSSSAVPCASALCTLHSRTCADFALGRAVGFRAGAVRRSGVFGRGGVGVRVRPVLRVRPRRRRLSRRPQSLHDILPCFRSSRLWARPRVRPCVRASVRKGRSRARHCENLVKHYAQVVHLALRLRLLVGILPTPRFFALLFLRSALALSLAGARIARG